MTVYFIDGTKTSRIWFRPGQLGGDLRCRAIALNRASREYAKIQRKLDLYGRPPKRGEPRSMREFIEIVRRDKAYNALRKRAKEAHRKMREIANDIIRQVPEMKGVMA